MALLEAWELEAGYGEVQVLWGAGLTLERRVADWSGAPFTSDSESHVSVWRKPPHTST